MSDKLRVQHILDAIAEVENYLSLVSFSFVYGGADSYRYRVNMKRKSSIKRPGVLFCFKINFHTT